MLLAAHHSALLQLAATWPDHVPDTGCAAIRTATQLRHWRWCEYWQQVAAEQLVDALDRQAAPVCMNPSVQEQQERKTACATHLAHGVPVSARPCGRLGGRLADAGGIVWLLKHGSRLERCHTFEAVHYHKLSKQTATEATKGEQQHG